MRAVEGQCFVTVFGRQCVAGSLQWAGEVNMEWKS